MYAHVITRKGKRTAIRLNMEYGDTFPIITCTPKNFNTFDTEEGARGRLRMTISDLQKRISKRLRHIADTKRNTPEKFSLVESKERIEEDVHYIAKFNRAIERLESDVQVVRVKTIRVPLTIYVTQDVIA